jgi:hypothetical protein
MAPDTDHERLRRLRDRQIATRDPQTKARTLHGNIARKQRRSVEAFSLGKIWSGIPHLWKDAFYGFLLGVVLIVVVPMLWNSPWATPVAAGTAILLTIIGLFVGRAEDTRDSLRDLTR